MTQELKNESKKKIGTPLPNWVNLYKSEVNKIGRRAVEAVELEIRTDRTFRVPVIDAKRKGSIDEWLQGHRERSYQSFEKDLLSSIPMSSAWLDQSESQRVFEEYVWPDVKNALLRPVIRAATAVWALNHIGDAVILGLPERSGQGWQVPIGIRGHGGGLTVVRLDEGAAVTSSPDHIRQIIRQAQDDRPLSSTSPTSG